LFSDEVIFEDDMATEAVRPDKSLLSQADAGLFSDLPSHMALAIALRLALLPSPSLLAFLIDRRLNLSL
jgi:hypothetical protein